MVKKKTKESQYQVLVSHLEEKGATELGIAVNYEWNDDPRRFLFMLSRYKFAAKMLTGKSSVLEVGCGDAFGVRMLLQEVDNVYLSYIWYCRVIGLSVCIKLKS